MATIWFHDRSEKAYLRKKTKVHKLTKIHYDKLPPEKRFVEQSFEGYTYNRAI
jgi:hypothetical protein